MEPTKTSTTGSPRRGRIPLWVSRASWGYLFLVCVLWVLMRWLGDRWWIGTVLLLGPRWAWGLPLAGLVPVAAVLRPRSLVILGAAALMVVFPVMGLCIPPPHWPTAATASPALRVLTCNLHGKSADLNSLTRLLREVKPDVVALQEWPHAATLDPFADGTWYVAGEGELRLASRYPVVPIHDRSEEAGGFVRYQLLLGQSVLDVFNVHLVTPHRALDELAMLEQSGIQNLRENIAARSRQSAAIAELARASQGAALLAGDFNTPCDSTIFHRDWSNGFGDAFASSGFGFGYTYRVRRTATQIDHIVFGPRWRCTRCWVAGGIGSPHRPLVADVELSGR